jgi:hypothetical protein
MQTVVKSLIIPVVPTVKLDVGLLRCSLAFTGDALEISCNTTQNLIFYFTKAHHSLLSVPCWVVPSDSL